jgi:hypothetical protein
MRFSRASAVAAAAVAIASAALVLSAPAGAATHCTAWGAMPARLALHTDRTVVKIVLRGSSGCHDQRTDNGASAALYYPAGSHEDMRWRHFGGTQAVTLYVNIVRSGTFTLSHGNVQVYDRRYERVPYSWTTTRMAVKRAARIVHVSASGGVVAGRAIAFTKYGWTGYHGKRVYVQRRPAGSGRWHTLGSVQPAGNGRFRFYTPTTSRYVHRMYLTASANVWNARSVQVRG